MQRKVEIKCSTDSIEYAIQRIFIEYSKLHSYLAKKTKLIRHGNRRYTLYEVLLALREVISREGLFNSYDPKIINCDSELEEILKSKKLHVNEVINRVCRHFVIHRE